MGTSRTSFIMRPFNWLSTRREPKIGPSPHKLRKKPKSDHSSRKSTKERQQRRPALKFSAFTCSWLESESTQNPINLYFPCDRSLSRQLWAHFQSHVGGEARWCEDNVPKIFLSSSTKDWARNVEQISFVCWRRKKSSAPSWEITNVK